MKMDVAAFAFLIGSVLFARPALADIYTWVDKDGTVHFQDQPPEDGTPAKKVQSTSVDPPRVEPPAGENGAPRDAGARPGSPPQKESVSAPVRTEPRPAPVVDLFTTNWCPWCKKAREYFSDRGIRFTEHDIEKDAGALGRKIGIDGDKRVPTVIIDGKVVRGYSPSAYQAALERR